MLNMSVKARHYSRLNKHRKDVKNPKAILADQHFKKNVIDLTITNRLTNAHLFKEILRERPIKRENFLIQKLKIAYPKGLNKELNI